MTFSQIGPFWRGHLLLFDHPDKPTYDSRTGVRLLLIVLGMEGVVRPLLLYFSRWLEITEQTWWMITYVTVITVLVFWLVTVFTHLPASSLGLYSWKRWSATEKFYFIQVIPIAIVVFSYFSLRKLADLWARPNVPEIALTNFLPEMIWGFYQEFIYRGMLQTELVRRWGGLKGILVSNVIFTFGPLHAYHFLIAQKNPSHLWMFAAIFAIGLLFSIIFKRSGNLWIVGVMHGLGDVFLVGLPKI